MFLLVFQMDILGNDINAQQLENKDFILVTLSVFHFDISGKDFNSEHA